MSLMSNTCVLGTMQKQTGLFWALVKHAASPRRLFAIFPPQRLFTQSVIHKRGRGKNSDCFTVAMHMCENITGVCELGKKEKKKKKEKPSAQEAVQQESSMKVYQTPTQGWLDFSSRKTRGKIKSQLLPVAMSTNQESIFAAHWRAN